MSRKLPFYEFQYFPNLYTIMFYDIYKMSSSYMMRVEHIDKHKLLYASRTTCVYLNSLTINVTSDLIIRKFNEYVIEITFL